ncbi:MAG: glycosyltransferase family 2 protein [Dysgonamonadaceae bacterium]|jgi:glycosyltransferase involved in cell wall biosynthesis|nr:glycosyltransferase family 2 protein [Dysgonamonadaceae bacterium]
MSTPLFSVVICTYNRAKYLEQTLQSVVSQDYPSEKFEIVVVDNNSPDRTEAASFSFRDQYKDLTIRYFKELQQGISYGRNRGVSEASGEYIVFLDDDETVEPVFLQNLEDFYTGYKDASLTAGPVIPVYETTPPNWLSPFTMRLITGAYDKGKEIKIVGPKDYPGTGHATFRRSLFRKYGGFNTDLGRKGSSLLGAEDKDFFFRLIRNGVKCFYVPGAAIYHHIPASKLTADFFGRLTYSIGVSERVRTLSESKNSYFKRLFSEVIKWGASVILAFYYTIIFQFPKAKKILLFRYNVTLGMLKKTP